MELEAADSGEAPFPFCSDGGMNADVDPILWNRATIDVSDRLSIRPPHCTAESETSSLHKQRREARHPSSPVITFRRRKSEPFINGGWSRSVGGEIYLGVMATISL